MQFGKSLLPLFPMDEKYININHASVGMEPIHITQKRFYYIQEINKNNELWIRYKMDGEILKNREAIAQYVGCKAKEIAFSRNATEAFQDVLSAITWKENDTLLYTSVAYLAMKNQMKHLSKEKKVNSVELQLTVEMINDRSLLLQFFEEQLIANQNNNLKAFAFDHISSVPSFIFPVKEIVDLCRKYNCLAICDGAQVPGQIPVNIHSLGVDYYVSNMHKWGFTPRPFAFIFIKESLQEGVHPTIIGNLYGSGFEEEFNKKGTGDNSPFLTGVDALQFREMLGEQRILDYCKNLANRAGEIFTHTWQTQVLIKNKELYGSLVCVEVPKVQNMADMTSIVTSLLKEQNFYLVHFHFHGKIYVRISANIYNDESDYEKCSKIALEYFNKFYDEKKEQ